MCSPFSAFVAQFVLLVPLLAVGSIFAQVNTNGFDSRGVSGDIPDATPHDGSLNLRDGQSERIIPLQLQSMFQQLVKLGRSIVKDAKFVNLELVNTANPSKNCVETAWVISDDDNSITVMKGDLLSWTYRKNGPTVTPSNWQPESVLLDSISNANVEELCQKLSKDKDKSADMDARIVRHERQAFSGRGPSYRALIAHAAWKRGLTSYCVPIVSADPLYQENFAAYQTQVLEDLAWLHFLRGVNLLMYADREEVLPHLRLVAELSPNGQFTEQSTNLLQHLQKLITEKKKPRNVVDESLLDDTARAEFYVSQIKDHFCRQMGQPGRIDPYLAFVDGRQNPHPPTQKLRDLGMIAVPALITSLEDETPTRTVYHWRDYHKGRLVWRVSDFAWHILRDITKRDLGNRPVIGFTFSNMPPVQKRQIVRDLERWYVANHSLSDEDRMFKLFSSDDSDDWVTAGRYFVEHKYSRAVTPLIEKIQRREAFVQGELCELVAHFRDQAAIDVIRQVLMTAKNDSDRLSAAIALWMLGDDSGVPIAINYVRAKDPPDCHRDLPVWFLMLTKSNKSMETLKSIVEESSPDRAGEMVSCVMNSITGDLWNKRRQPVGNIEICPTLIAAMNRPEYTQSVINDIKLRIKDIAANAFVLLRNGISHEFPDRSMVDPKVFNQLEPDESKRDAQITALIDWYDANRQELFWDSESGKLRVSQ